MLRTCSGVLETVRIRRQGFPFRQTYYEFWETLIKKKLYKLVPGCETIGPVVTIVHHSPSKPLSVSTKGKRAPSALARESDLGTPLPPPLFDDALVSPEEVHAAQRGVTAFLTALLPP